MPSVWQTLANSSGTEAPSRKLKADRACNSTYISRIHLAQTICPKAHRKKNDRTHALWKTWGKTEFPDPMCLPARAFLPTSDPKCATALMHEQLSRSILETMRMPAYSHPAGLSRGQEAEKREEQFAGPVLFVNSFPNYFAQWFSLNVSCCCQKQSDLRKQWEICPCETHQAGANPAISVSRRFHLRRRKRCAQW